MPPAVTIDARDAGAPEPRGWGRYASCLTAAIQQLAPSDLEIDALTVPGRGPEIAFEQLGLPMHLRRRGSALVHATNCFLPLVRTCPGVVTIHDLAFEAWPGDFSPRTRVKYRLLTRLAARSAQRIIVPSDFTRGDLVTRFGVDEARIRVIPEAPALAQGELSSPPGRYVLAVGDLRAKKNLHMLVRAFAEVVSADASEGVRLVLAGIDTGEGPGLRAAAAGARVELTGYLDDARLDAMIRGAEVVVHPSRYEGFGLVVLEAMARGTPVIVASGTALTQTAGAAAESFDPEGAGAVAELATKLAGLLQNPAARADLSRRGREHALRFSWERTAELTLSVYRELL